MVLVIPIFQHSGGVCVIGEGVWLRSDWLPFQWSCHWRIDADWGYMCAWMKWQTWLLLSLLAGVTGDGCIR